MHSPKRKKNNSIDNYIKYSFFADHSFEDEKNNNDKRGNEKSKFYKNPNFLTQQLKVEILKERNIKKKKKY